MGTKNIRYETSKYNIALAAAGPLMRDRNDQILNWHAPHGGHHAFFDGVEHTHGGHGGPKDAEGQAIHGHGPHGGHAQSAILDETLNELMAEIKDQKKKRMAAAEEQHEHQHGHGDQDDHTHGHGNGHGHHGHHGAHEAHGATGY